MNGSNGIVPTVDLATNNTYPYPVMGGYGYGNNGFFGGDGIWALVLLALLFGNGGWGNNGFGGFGGFGLNNIATTDYISSEFTQRDINGGFQNTNNLISSGFSDAATNLCNVRSDILTGNMALQNSILSSSCSTQRDILSQTNELNTNLLTTQLNAQAHLDKCCCDLRAQGIENTQKILDAINTQSINALNQKIDDLNRENVSLKDVISDRAQTETILSRLQPTPIPAYLTASPYIGFNSGYGWNGGFYGNGFYGNTII